MRNMKVALNLGCTMVFVFAVTSAHAQSAISQTEPTYFVKPKQASVLPGSTLVVDVFLANATDIGAVQIQVVANDQQNNKLAMTSITVDEQSPLFLFGSDQIVKAIDTKGERIALVKYNGGVTAPTSKPKYICTFSFDVPADATGSVSVGVAAGQETMLLISSGAERTYTVSSPVTVEVVTDRVRSIKKGRSTR